MNLDGAGTTVAAVNARLREQKIFGGYDLSRQFPELGQSMLVCVTEVHTKATSTGSPPRSVKRSDQPRAPGKEA